MRIYIYFSLLPCIFIFGSALQCYESLCHSFPDGTSLPCDVEKVNCAKRGFDRCMTIRATMTISNRVIYQEIRNCTYAVACSIPDQVCKVGNATGKYKDCQMSCCHGDLCNNNTGLVTKETTKPSRPMGTELSCYSCVATNTTKSGSKSVDSCSQSPLKQSCGKSGTTGLVQDRCMTIRVKGRLVTQELRNCSDAIYCTGNNYCRSANRSASGTLTYCSVSCCYGNLCNSDVTSTDSSVTTKRPNMETELFSTTKPSLANQSPTNNNATMVSRGIVTQLSLKAAVISVIGAFLLCHTT